ncbi:MAG: hypothetical protein IJ399_01315 [Bacilli bacterium]|nr:hypothetical protein [Bacilli bacterium]
MENNSQENNVNINITNNEENKPEKKGLPIYLIPTIIVLVICIAGGIFLSSLDFSEEKNPSTPSDEKTEENKEENNQDIIISTPNDDELIISTMTDDEISTPSN